MPTGRSISPRDGDAKSLCGGSISLGRMATLLPLRVSQYLITVSCQDGLQLVDLNLKNKDMPTSPKPSEIFSLNPFFFRAASCFSFRLSGTGKHDRVSKGDTGGGNYARTTCMVIDARKPLFDSGHLFFHRATQEKRGRSKVLLPLFGFKGRIVRIEEIKNRPSPARLPPRRQRRPGQAPGPLAWWWLGT
jgi:hypothetical protein